MLNDMKSGECEICGGMRHVDVSVNADSNKSGGTREQVTEQLHKRSQSNATGSSKSSESKHSRQSEVSKRSTLDPPAECNTKSAANKMRIPTAKTRQSKQGNRRPSAAKKGQQHNNTKSDAKMKANESNNHNSHEPISGTEAIQSLSSAPLAGEGTTHAIAALLGLTQELSINDRTDHADNSKYSGSKDSEGNARNTGEVSDTNQSNRSQNEGGRKRRTTFSHEVQNISNRVKLNKKIQEGREKADKIKAVKRGELVVVGNDDNAKKNGVDNVGEYDDTLFTELCAGAKPFVPGSSVEEKKAKDESTRQRLQREDSKKYDSKKEGKGKKKVTKTKNKVQSSHNENQAVNKVAEVKPHGLPDNKSSKGKGQPPMQISESATNVNNLTLDAIKQSKQQHKKCSAAKQKKVKSDPNGTTQTKKSDLRDNSTIENDEKKTQSKQTKITGDKTKQNQKTKVNKSQLKKEKSINQNKKSKASSETLNSLSPAIPPNQSQTTNDLNYGAGRPIVSLCC